MVNLHKTENPISRIERVKINENWDMIKARFSNLQYQINFLSGEEVDVIVNRINDAIANAESVTTNAEEKLIEISDALAQLSTVITNAVNATTRADGAADDANVLNVALTQLKGELEQLQVDLTGIVQAESQRVINEGERVANEDERKDNENDRALAEQSRVNAETNRETAEGLRNDAEVIRQQKLAELLAILNELDFKGEYDPTASYKAFNVVRYGRASYVALQDVSGIIPNDDGINWRILAAGGMDGAGAVSSVNEQLPDSNGNINIIIDYINNVTSDRIDAGLSAAMGKFLMSLITALQTDKVDAAFVDAEVNRLIAAAPGMLDTFEEIANALNNDPNFANTIINLLNDKASVSALGQTNDSLAQTNNNLSTLQQRVTTHLDNLTWYSATLINGFTGRVSYAKNNHGTVFIKMQIDNLPSITPMTAICNLPEGYRPVMHKPIPVNHINLSPFGNSMPFHISASDGNIYVSHDNRLYGTSVDAILMGGVTYHALS